MTQTTWIRQKGTYEFVPKPEIPFKSKGATKYDALFDHMIDQDVAMTVPENDLPSILKAWSRYEANKGIEKKYSVRRKINARKKEYTFWVQLREVK